MKTIEEIAKDCGIGPAMLERVLQHGAEHNATPELLQKQVIALYQRIEKLEDQLRLQTKSWDETLAENRKLEEEKLTLERNLASAGGLI
jgi:hypothetical protein